MSISAILKSLRKNCIAIYIKNIYIYVYIYIYILYYIYYIYAYIYSSLTDTETTDKEYEHVLNVWNKFEIIATKYYHNLQLKYDVFLLADVFEKFKNNN